MSKNNEKKDIKYEEFIIENSVYLTEVPESFKNRELYAPLDPKKVLAAIPGTIVDIYIKEGQMVKEGDDLLILEAMKMRNKVKSPLDGEIKSIKIKTGELVRKNSLLIEIK